MWSSVIVWQLDQHRPTYTCMQALSIITKVTSLIPIHSQCTKHNFYVIKFVGDLFQIDGFLLACLMFVCLSCLMVSIFPSSGVHVDHELESRSGQTKNQKIAYWYAVQGRSFIKLLLMQKLCHIIFLKNIFYKINSFT